MAPRSRLTILFLRLLPVTPLLVFLIGMNGACATSTRHAKPPAGSAAQAHPSSQADSPSIMVSDTAGASNVWPSIEFDTKGVDFGPWIRGFIAQLKSHWSVPYAPITLKGHVVVIFTIMKDGTITDLAVRDRSNVEGFNRASYDAVAGTKRSAPLPREYPSDCAFFVVTFWYNELPPKIR